MLGPSTRSAIARENHQKGRKRPTHETIISREIRKYGPDWIILREQKYGPYIFDILAFNPKTKQLEIVEVDFSNKTDDAKIEFARTLGEVRVERATGQLVQRKEFQSILDCLGDPFRVALLESLSSSPATYTQIASALSPPGEDFTKKQGTFNFHLTRLSKTGLIAKQDRQYVLTEIGRIVVELLVELSQKLPPT